MLRCVALCCAALRCVVLRCVVLRCVVLRCVALRCVVLRCVALCCVVLRCVALHCVVLRLCCDLRFLMRTKKLSAYVGARAVLLFVSLAALFWRRSKQRIWYGSLWFSWYVTRSVDQARQAQFGSAVFDEGFAWSGHNSMFRLWKTTLMVKAPKP